MGLWAALKNVCERWSRERAIRPRTGELLMLVCRDEMPERRELQMQVAPAGGSLVVGPGPSHPLARTVRASLVAAGSWGRTHPRERGGRFLKAVNGLELQQVMERAPEVLSLGAKLRFGLAFGLIWGPTPPSGWPPARWRR